MRTLVDILERIGPRPLLPKSDERLLLDVNKVVIEKVVGWEEEREEMVAEWGEERKRFQRRLRMWKRRKMMLRMMVSVMWFLVCFSYFVEEH